MSTNLLRRLKNRWTRRLSGVSGPFGPTAMPTGHAAPPVVVPLTGRACTADQAEVRLLLEAVVAPSAAATGVLDLERIATALVIPAAEREVALHPLASLKDELARVRAAIEDAVRPEFTGLGATLLRLDVVAVEHLLVSPSTDVTAPDGCEGGD